MEEKQNKRKTIILLIIGTIALIGVVVGATFAYFAAQVGTGEKTTLDLHAGTTDSLTFNITDIDVRDNSGKILDENNNEDDNVIINANQTNFGPNGSSLGDGVKLEAHLIAGDDDNEAHYKYNIYLDIASNNFEYTSGSEPELVLLVQDPEGTYLEEIPGLTKSNITIDGESHPCFDITTQSGLIAIQEDYLIDATPETQGKADHAWNITIVFKNLPNDQHNNTNKTFNAKITIQSEKMKFLDIGGGQQYAYYREDTYRNNIKNAYIIDHIDTEKLNSSVKSYDLSSEKDGSIMGWLVQETNDELVPYNLYIGSNEKIMVRDFSSAFSNMYNLETVDLGKNILDTTYMNNMSYMFNYYDYISDIPESKLREIKGIDNLDTHNVTNMSAMFHSASALTELDLSGWDTHNVIDMHNMFAGDSSLISLNLSNWNTSKVTDMSGMFSGAYSLTIGEIGQWDTHSVTDMSYMFSSVKSLTTLDLSSWDTHNVTDMSGMFQSVSALTELDLSGWDTHNVIDMHNMFAYTSSLKTLKVNNWVLDGTAQYNGNDGPFYQMFCRTTNLQTIEGIETWDVSKVTNMYGMFSVASGLTTLDLSKWDTSNVTDMSYMFSCGFNNKCALIELNLNNWDTSNVTKMSSMFAHTYSLKTLKVNNWVLDGTAQYNGNNGPFSDMFYGTFNLQTIEGIETWDVSKVTNMYGMFASAEGLTKLDLSGWDTQNVTNMSCMFNYAKNLTNIDMQKATFSQVTNYISMFGRTNSDLKITVTGEENKRWLMEKPGLAEEQILFP